MTLKSFAEKYRLTIKKGEDGIGVIFGKYGQIYEMQRGKFAVLFLPDEDGSKRVSPKMWTGRKRKMLAAGFVILQDCSGKAKSLLN